MGQMGQGGPMMGGGATATVAAPDPLTVALLVLLVVVVAVLAVGIWWRSGRPPPERGSPAEALRARYARGEITARQYRDALVGVLKDRYVRGEIELDEFEEMAARLVRDGPPTEAAVALLPVGLAGDGETSEQANATAPTAGRAAAR
jgi:uncharacterized membrane protein